MSWMIIRGDAQHLPIADKSIDAIVTDPPYGLEFMGKEWDKLWRDRTVADVAYVERTSGKLTSRARRLPDYGAQPEQMQRFHVLWALEAFRVLKPGGYLLAFGGTRTYHRLACAIEDAGFEIRDCMMWLYGCLSADTELLVDGKWEPYHKAIAGRLALCYDVENETFRWRPINELFVYDYNDTAYRIQSDCTDQIVSRNHRCIVEQSGKKVFRFAEEIARQREARVPVLENLPALLEAVPLPDSRASSKKQDLLSAVRSTGAERAATEKADVRPSDDVNRLHRLWPKKMARKRLAEKGPLAYLLLAMQRSASRSRMGESRSQRTSRLDAGERNCLAKTNDGSWKSGLERWRHLLQEAWQLCRSQIRALSERVFVYGTERRLCDGAQTFGSASHWQMLDANRSCTSRDSQSARQHEANAVQEQSRSQTVRASRFTKTSLARIVPVEYSGKVWCISVPTGAFVARRNGKVFVTGNSGFPKSLDVSKAIDKAAGAKREVIGIKADPRYLSPRRNSPNHMDRARGVEGGHGENSAVAQVTASATDAAKEWQGWGTALKPAWEPIIVARKPIEKNVAHNVQKYGTGAINIDACRIAGEPWKFGAQSDIRGGGYGSQRPSSGHVHARNVEGGHNGRFPANLILSHHPECEQVGVKKVKAAGGDIAAGSKGAGARRNDIFGEDARERGEWRASYKDADGNETVEDWRCHEDCPVRLLDEQSGDLSSPRANGNPNNPKHGKQHEATSYGWGYERESIDYRDTGGASRFFYTSKADKTDRGEGNDHPTVKPQALMEYLLKLVSRPGSIVLDPFAGSGTTILVGDKMGRNMIGIDKDKKYPWFAHERVKRDAPLFNL